MIFLGNTQAQDCIEPANKFRRGREPADSSEADLLDGRLLVGVLSYRILVG